MIKKAKGKKESTTVNLKQASIRTCAASTAGKELALIFYGKAADNQGN